MIDTIIHLRKSLFVLLLLLIGPGSTTWAQNYARPNGKNVDPAVATSCDTFADPCNLASAVREAILDGGTTVNVITPNSGATVTFQEDLDGTAEIRGTVSFDATLTDPPASTTAFIAVDGDIVIDGAATLAIAEDVELRLVGQPGQLELHDGATIDGPGFIAFTATGGDHTIVLGERTAFDCLTATPPNEAFLWNVRVEKINGDVQVIDECGSDDPSNLFISNRLNVEAGVLNMEDNNLFLDGLSDDSGGDDAGVTISGGAIIQGAGTLFIAVEKVGQSGFPNDSDNCFEIGGTGNLNMAFDKITDAGVCIDLDEVGVGGFSFNRAGALFVREAIQLNGSFRNEGSARTEFWMLNAITANLEIFGPGGEVNPAATNFQNGVCDGNESGVYFLIPVMVEGDVDLDDTDDPNTALCVEGVQFVVD